MGNTLYDKTLGLEVEADELRNYNPNLVKPKGSKQFVLNKTKTPFSGLEMSESYIDSDPTLQEHVGQYFANDGLYKNYLEREDINPSDLDDLNEVQYRNQTTGEAWRNGFTSRFLSIAPKVANLPGVIGGLVVSAADLTKDAVLEYGFNDPNTKVNLAKSMDYTFNNFWVNAMGDADEGLKKLMPVMGSKYGYYSNSLLDNLGSAKFWAEDGLDGVAFTVSALAPGVGWMKGLSAMSEAEKGLGFFTKAAGFMKYGKAAEKLAELPTEKLIELGVNRTSQFLTTATNVINESALEAHDYSKSLNKDEYIANRLKNDPRLKKILAMEARLASMPPDITGVENGGVGEKAKLDMQIQREKYDLKKSLDEDFIKEKQSGALGVFGANMAILTVPDFIQSKFLHKAFGKSTKLFENEIRSSADKAIKTNAAKAFAKSAGVGIASEGFWEENSQTAVQDYYKNRANTTINLKDSQSKGLIDLIGGTIDNMANNAETVFGMSDNPNNEGAKAIILGAATGGLSTGMMGGWAQIGENQNAKIADKQWDLTKTMAQASMTSFLDRFNKVTDANGKLSMTDMIKAFTYSMNNKNIINSQNMALLLDNEIMHNLGVNDELAKKFFRTISQVDGKKYLNNKEAVELLKHNLNERKNQEGIDEKDVELLDRFISKIDLLHDNWNKANQIVEETTKDANDTTKEYKSLLAKTLFFGLNKQSEINEILKDGSISKNQKQIDALSELNAEINGITSKFNSIDHLNSIVDKLHKEANEHLEIKKQIKDEKAKPAEERDNTKIKTLEYQLDELAEIHGWLNESDKSRTYNWGEDGFKMSMAPTDIINRASLGIRDQFFYDMGRSALSLNNVDNLINDDNVEPSDIRNFIESEDFHYISKENKDKLISKYRLINKEKINKYESEVKSIYDGIDPTDMDAAIEAQAKEREVKYNYGYNDGVIDDSDEVEKVLNEKFRDKDNERNEFLGSEENATQDSYIKNIRRRIAKSFLSRMANLNKNIEENKDSYSNDSELSSAINSINDRIEVFRNSDLHKDLLNGYVESLEKIRDSLQEKAEIVAKNKNNKNDLDNKLNDIKNKSIGVALGFKVENGKISIIDNELYNAIKSAVGDVLWNAFEKDVITDWMELDSIFFDKLVLNLDSESKLKVISAINNSIKKKSDEVESKYILDDTVDKTREQAKILNSAIKAFLKNPLTSPIQLFVRVGGNIPIGFLVRGHNNRIQSSFVNSKGNDKNISDRFLLHGDLHILLEESLAIAANGSPVLMNENPNLTRQMYDDTISLIRSAIELRSMADVRQQLESNASRKAILKAETEISQTQTLAPSKQQRNVIKSVLSWIFTNNYNELNGFSGAKLINGLAGTGKTTIVASTIFKILSKISKLNVNTDVVVLGPNSHVSENMADSIGKSIDNTVSTISDFSNPVFTVAQNVKYIVIDEVGTLNEIGLKALEEKIRAINSDRIKNGGQVLKVLMFGDPNQVQSGTNKALPPIVRGTDTGGNLVVTSEIETTDVLSVQYRSDVDAINAVADSFAGRQYNVSGISAKSNTAVSDFSEKNPLGVHAAKSTGDFIQRLKFAILNSAEKIVVAYNTEEERKEVEKALSKDELNKVNLMHYKDIQGLTLKSLFVNVKDSSEFKLTKYKFNSIMYMLASRPKNYLCINDSTGKFDNTIDTVSMNASSDRNRTQMAENVGNYKRRIQIEDSILNGKTPTKTKTKEAEPSKETKTADEVSDSQETINQEAEYEQYDMEEDPMSDDEVNELKSKINNEHEVQQEETTVNESTGEEKPTSIKIGQPSSRQIKSQNLKAGDELFVLATGNYGSKNKTRRYLLVKKDESTGRYFEVGVMSESELKSLGLSEDSFKRQDGKSFETTYQTQETGYDSVAEKTFATKDGNPIKISVDKNSSLKIKYLKENPQSGPGFINKIIGDIVQAITGKVMEDTEYQAEIFLPKETNMKPGSQYSNLNLQLGVPYLIVKVNGRTIYVRLEQKRFNKETSWNLSTGENAFEIIESFRDGVKAIGDYFSSIGNNNVRFGGLNFRNFIYALAGKSSKALNIDNSNNVISIPKDIHFDSFNDVTGNETHASMLEELFNGDIEALNTMLNNDDMRKQLLNVIKANFDVKDDEAQPSPKQLIDNGDEFGFKDSYDKFIRVMDWIFSTKEEIPMPESKPEGSEAKDDWDRIEENYGISNRELITQLITLSNKFKKRANIDDKRLKALSASVMDAFDNNKLFPKNSSDAIVFDGVNKEDVKAMRDILKLILKVSPIIGQKDGQPNGYQWIAEKSEEKGSKKHLVTYSDGKTTVTKATKRLSSTESKIQKVFNYIARSNKSINGKNIRKLNSKEKTKKTGYAVNSVNVFWENDERNNEDFPEEIRDLHFDHTAQSYDQEVIDDMIAKGDLEGVRAITDSYTINEAELDEVVNGTARRQISKADIKNANSKGMDEIERYTESGFNGVQTSELYVSNEGSDAKSKPSVVSEAEDVTGVGSAANEIGAEQNLDITSVDGQYLGDIDNWLLLEKDEDSSKRLGKEISENEALKYLKKIIPSANENTLRFLDKIRSQSKEAYGRFISGVIELEKTGRKTVYRNVLRHEAFHKIWNEFLTNDIKSEIVAAYLDTLSDEQMFELEGLPKNELFKLLEERIARQYQSYNENDDMGIIKASFAKLKAIIRNIYNIITNNRSELNHYFDLIDFGFFNKKLNQFDGIRNYNGIIADYKSLDNYIAAKEFVAKWYGEYLHTGSSTSNIPLSQQEINGYILARAKAVVEKYSKIIETYRSQYEANTLTTEQKQAYEDKLLTLEGLRYLTEESKGGNKSFEKMLDELLPGRKDNKLWNNVMSGISFEEDEDENEDVDTGSESTAGIEAPFEQNSDKHDRETKVFANVKHFLSTIKKIGKDEFVSSRKSFMTLFKYMEGLDNGSENIVGDILKRLSYDLTKVKGKILTEDQLSKYKKDEVAMFYAIRNLYNKANDNSYAPEFVGKNGIEAGESLNGKIAVVLDKNGDIRYIAYNKGNEEIIGEIHHNLKSNPDVIIYDAKDIELSRNNKSLVAVNNAIELFKQNGIEVKSHEIAGVARKEVSRNMLVEIQNTFTSLRESNLTFVKSEAGLYGTSYDVVLGASSEKNVIESEKVIAKLLSKFNNSKSIERWLKDNVLKFNGKENHELSKSKIVTIEDRSAKEKYVRDFYKIFGISNRELDLALIENDSIDAIVTSIYYFVERFNDSYTRSKANPDSEKSDEQIQSEITGESVDSKASFIEDLINDEGSFINEVSGLIISDQSRKVPGRFKDAKGKKRYTITMTQFADRVLKQFMDESKLPEYFGTDFMKNNAIMRGFQKIHKFTLHAAINYKNNLFDDRIVEYDSEGFEQYVHRTIFADFMSSFKQLSKHTGPRYYQPTYIKSNRKDTQAAVMNVLTQHEIFEKILPSVFDQFTSQDLKALAKWRVDEKQDTINPLAFVGMQYLRNALEYAYGEKVSDDQLLQLIKDKVKFNDLEKSISDKIKESFMNQFESKANELAEMIIEKNVKLDSKFADIYRNILSFSGLSKDDIKAKMDEAMKGLDPKQFSGEKAKSSNTGVYSNKKEMLIEPLKLFLMNTYFNSYSLNQMYAGNANSFKSDLSLLKRMSVIFGPGVNLTVGINGIKEKAKVLVVKDPTYGNAEKAKWFKHLRNSGVSQEIIDKIINKNQEDTINYADGQGYITPKRYEELVRSVGTTYNLANVGKPLWYDVGPDSVAHAIKYSWIVITDELIAKDTSGDLKNMRDLMEKHDIDELVFESAVKVGLPKGAISHSDLISGKEISKENVEASTIEMSNKNYRLQLNPWHEFGDENVATPSQMMFILNVMGDNAENALNAYDAMSNLIELGLKNTQKSMNDEEGFSNKKTSKILDEKLKASKSAESEFSMREAGVSYDFPTLSSKAVSQLASIFERNTIGKKFRGGKAILQASFGHKNREGKELTFNVLKKNGKEFISAECLISRGAASKILSKEQIDHLDEFFANPENATDNPKLSFVTGDLLGFRIPSSELHSGVALNIVGWLEDDSVSIVVPQRIVEIHGSDFDVDSLFLIGKDVVRDENGNPLNYKLVDGNWVHNKLSKSEINELSNKDKERYYKNFIAELILESVADSKNAVRAQSPISVKIIRDMIKVINDKVGSKKDKLKIDLSDFMDSFNANQSVMDGLIGVGIFANAFKVLAYSMTGGENKTSPALSFGEKDLLPVFNGNAVTNISNKLETWELIDALVNAAVDNVKEQVLPFFNLNSNTMSSFVGMLSTAGFELAGFMSKQLFFSDISKVKGGVSRDAGFDEASDNIKKILELELTDFEVDNSNVTTDELAEAIKLANDLKIKSLNNLYRELAGNQGSKELRRLAALQVKFFKNFKIYKKIGDDLTKLSGAMSVLRKMPSTMEEIESKMDSIEKIFDRTVDENGNVKFSPKEDFSITIPEIFEHAPHLLSSFNVLENLKKTIELFVFKHGQEVADSIKLIEGNERKDGIDEDNAVEEEDNQDEAKVVVSDTVLNTAKKRNSIKDSIMTFLMNTLEWDKEFIGYDNLPDVEIKVGNEMVTASGQDAFKKNFANKILALKSYLRDHNITNEFLHNLIGNKKWDGVEEWTMPTAVDLKSEDIVNMKNEFNKLSKYDIKYVDGKWIVSEADNIDYKDWQKDFVRYGTMVYGMSFGATNFSMAIPEGLYVRLSERLDRLVSDIKYNPKLLSRNIFRFYNQYIVNNAKNVQSYNEKPIKSKDTYYSSEIFNVDGVEKELFFDLKMPMKKGNIPSVIKRNSKRTIHVYKLVVVKGEYVYYAHLGFQKPSATYNLTADSFYEAEDVSFDRNRDKILDYDSKFTEESWDALDDVTKSKILFGSNLDYSVPNILVSNNKLNKFKVNKDVWAYLESKFGKGVVFRVDVRNISDVALSKVRSMDVILDGTKDSPRLIEAKDGMSWEHIRNKSFIKEDTSITEDVWNSLSEDERLKITSCN